jgi:hypothetical protein
MSNWWRFFKKKIKGVTNSIQHFYVQTQCKRSEFSGLFWHGAEHTVFLLCLFAFRHYAAYWADAFLFYQIREYQAQNLNKFDFLFSFVSHRLRQIKRLWWCKYISTKFSCLWLPKHVHRQDTKQDLFKSIYICKSIVYVCKKDKHFTEQFRTKQIHAHCTL